MQCGISTSCFYPQETAEALSALRGAGVETVEIFLNTFSELELSYTERLRSVLQDAGMRAAALHPFTSGMETFFFASEYGGRLEDGLRIYRRYFEVCRVLGIPRVVFHGDYRQTPFPFQRHCENYLLLRRTAREYGVDFCQENVVRCKCGLPEYVRQVREYTGLICSRCKAAAACRSAVGGNAGCDARKNRACPFERLYTAKRLYSAGYGRLGT